MPRKARSLAEWNPFTRPSVTILDGPQRVFVESQAPFVAIFGGRGAGKTSHLVHKAFLYMLQHSGARGILTEPTYRQVQTVLQPAIETLWGSARPGLWDWGAARLSCEFVNGSRLTLHYGDGPGAADAVRGMSLAFAGMDEAATGNQHMTFMVLAGCMRQELPGARPQLCVATTPNGYDWLYKMFVEKEDGTLRMPSVEDGGYLYVHADAWSNPYLPSAFIDNLKRAYGSSPLADQEIMGRFISLSGRAYPMFNRDLHVREPPPGAKWRRYVIGLDFGTVSPTAAVLVGEQVNGPAWALAEYYKAGVSYRDIAGALLAWPPCPVACDPAEPASITALRRAGLMARPARSRRFHARVSHISQRLSPGYDGKPLLYISPACPNLIEEIESLTFPRSGEADDYAGGCPDHAADALGYALMEMDKTLGGFTRPRPTIVR